MTSLYLPANNFTNTEFYDLEAQYVQSLNSHQIDITGETLADSDEFPNNINLNLEHQIVPTQKNPYTKNYIDYSHTSTFNFLRRCPFNGFDRLDIDARLLLQLKSFSLCSNNYLELIESGTIGYHRQKIQSYFPNINPTEINEFIKNPNIIIDTENLYNCDLGFPYYCLMNFIWNNTSCQEINLHLVSKREKSINVLIADIERIFSMNSNEFANGFVGSYSMNGINYSGRFKNLNFALLNFNFYFHKVIVNKESNQDKDSDDLYFLDLYVKLSQCNDYYAMFSNDYRMLDDHVYSKKQKTIQVTIKKLDDNYAIKSIQRPGRRDVLNVNPNFTNVTLRKWFSEKLNQFSDVHKNIYRIDSGHLELEYLRCHNDI